jgi:hypothetical protein
MAYEDPVKKAEREVAELEALIKQGQEQRPGELQDTGNETDPAKLQETQQAERQAKAEQTATPGLEEKYAALEQRHNTLTGKYNAEIPRLQGENAQLKGQVESLKRQLQEVIQVKGGEGSADGKAYVSPYVTDEDRSTRAYQSMLKDFGQEYAETHFEAAAEKTEREIRPLREENAAHGRDVFHSTIAGLSPNWERLNNDPAFIDWSKVTVEPYSGKTLNQLLNESYHGGNAAGVAKVFNDYDAHLNETAAPVKTETPVDERLALVQPTKRGSATGNEIDANKGKVWTHNEACKALDDIAAGRIKGKQAVDLEAEITKAYSEGKVI